MDLPFIINASMWFIVAVAFSGGCASYVLNKLTHDSDRIKAWDSRHRAEWNKDGEVVPLHRDCKTCEITVVEFGGRQPSHASIE